MQISPDGTTILDSNGHPIGTDPKTAFEGLLSGRRHPGVTGIGETTLLRALITRMAKDGQPVDFRQSSMAVLGDDRTPMLGEDPGGRQSTGPVLRSGETGNEARKDLAKDVLYSPSATPSPETIAAALQRKLATAGLTAQEHPQLTLVISGKIEAQSTHGNAQAIDQKLFNSETAGTRGATGDRLQAAMAHLETNGEGSGRTQEQKAAIVEWAKSAGMLLRRWR